MSISVAPLSAIAMMLGAALGPGTAPAPETEWVLASLTPGDPPCQAIKRGDTVDTQLVRNRVGNLILVAGHPGWSHGTGDLQVTVSIDGGPQVPLTGTTLGPVLLVEVKDKGLEKQFRDAHSLDWNLPWGHFKADVDGLGQAFDGLKDCPL
jgi:hypothetical protein